MIAILYNAAMLAALSPTERWGAARQMSNPEMFLSWAVWAPVLAASVAGAILIALFRHWSVRNRMLRAFVETAGRLDLGSNEQAILVRIAKLSDLGDYNQVFVAEGAFERGAGRLMMSRDIAAMPDHNRQRVAAVVDSLRTKLGFMLRAADQEGQDAAGLQPGTAVTFVRRGDPPKVEATVTRAEDKDVTIEYEVDVPLRLGEACAIRRTYAGLQWEYTVSIIEVGQQYAVARLIGQPRVANVRRFVRVVVRLPAHVAHFPFLEAQAAQETPQFMPGTLTEMAGPGLRIEGPTGLAVGDRVLVVIRAESGKVLRSLGAIRRVFDAKGEPPAVAVEMTGMSEAEMADLVRETNEAARLHHGAEVAETV